MRRVIFFVHGPSTLLTASLIKEIYHKTDKCFLLTTDYYIQYLKDFLLDNKIIPIWDSFDVLYHKKRSLEDIEHDVMNYIESIKPDVLYDGVMYNSVSHLLTHCISNNTKLVFMDEGTATINIIDSYKELKKSYGEIGYEDFNFKRIDEILAYDDSVVEPVYHASIREIELNKLLNSEDFETYIEKLNKLFGYKKEDCNRYIVIDSGDISDFGFEPALKIFWKYLVRMIGADNCCVKLKPWDCDQREAFWDSLGVKRMVNNKIPFELIYMNYIVEKSKVPIVLSVQSTVGKSVSLINKVYNLEQKNNYVLDAFVRQYFNTEYLILRLYEGNSEIKPYYPLFPETWNELADELILEIPFSETEYKNEIRAVTLT